MTPWTVAHQAPPSMGFSRQEYWSGVPLPSPRFYLGVDKKHVSHTALFSLATRNLKAKTTECVRVRVLRVCILIHSSLALVLCFSSLACFISFSILPHIHLIIFLEFSVE